MTAKEFLWQYQRLQQDIESKYISLANMRDRQGRVQGVSYERERVQTTPRGDQVDRSAINILQVEQEIKDLKKRQSALLSKIAEAIPDPKIYRIIISIYIDGFPTTATAYRFDMKKSRVSQIHTAGLKAIENYLNQNKQNT